jgi:hypothetical protein
VPQGNPCNARCTPDVENFARESLRLARRVWFRNVIEGLSLRGLRQERAEHDGFEGASSLAKSPVRGAMRGTEFIVPLEALGYTARHGDDFPRF